MASQIRIVLICLMFIYTSHLSPPRPFAQGHFACAAPPNCIDRLLLILSANKASLLIFLFLTIWSSYTSFIVCNSYELTVVSTRRLSFFTWNCWSRIACFVIMHMRFFKSTRDQVCHCSHFEEVWPLIICINPIKYLSIAAFVSIPSV